MELGFLLEFDIAGIAIFRQFAVFNRGLDRTAGLVFVTAIGIATMSGKPDKFFETRVDRVAGAYDAQFSHPWRVNQHRTLAENDELPA